ncbi:MAG: alpha/beta hydrolase-fold protein, partial [Bacteroidota bacterium]
MKIFMVLILILLSFSNVQAQDQMDFDYKIQSEAFGTERQFYVHLPERYYRNDLDSFGILFVLDAQSDTYYNNASGITDYLVNNYQIFPLIVVGVHSENRGSEFIPLDRSLDPGDSDNYGQAEMLREHISQEIWPVVQENFRVNEFKAIV